jgi:hypothetical protein
MPRKKIVREPVEKINEDVEQIAVIEDSDSEADMPPPPPKLKRQNAKPTRAPPKVKVPCEFCGKEFSKSGIRLHQQKCREKMGKVADAPAPVAAPPPPVENVIIDEPPIKQDDGDDVPKWFKQYLEAKEKPAPAPAAAEPKPKKRGRPAGVKNKPKAPPPPPSPPPTPQATHYDYAPPPQMRFV